MKPTLSRILGTLIGVFFVITIIVSVLRVVWNIIIPAVFNGPELSFGQTLLIYTLFNLFRFDWIQHFNNNLRKLDLNQPESKEQNRTI